MLAMVLLAKTFGTKISSSIDPEALSVLAFFFFFSLRLYTASNSHSDWSMQGIKFSNSIYIPFQEPILFFFFFLSGPLSAISCLGKQTNKKSHPHDE